MLLPGPIFVWIASIFVKGCWGQSSVVLDWTFATPQDLPIRDFNIDYYPPIGNPLPNTTLPSTQHTLEINNTLSATDYWIVLTANLETEDNRVFSIFNRTIASSPDEPILEYVQANETGALVSFFPPDGEGLTYYLEYYPVTAVENAKFMETNNSLVNIEDLSPGTEYSLRVMTVFKGVPSKAAANTTFETIQNTTRRIVNESDPYAQPLNVRAAREGGSLRIIWDSPDDANCTGYRVNYTVTTLHNPKSFQKEVRNRTYLLIKLLEKHKIVIEVYCIAGAAEISDQPGRAVADLRAPDPIQNLTLSTVETDEFFQSNVVIEWDWPGHHDFEKYTILVSYFPGKAKTKRIDIIVKEKEPVKIKGLKPTEQYSFLIRNISQFDVKSKVKGIRQIMPPIISSTLYPGEITSNSININFSPTDSDQAKFDKYQFVFQFTETTNITQTRSTSDETRSFTFEHLVPGKTYRAFLYTVYKDVRSRAVMSSFTTYPLKVKSVLPVVRRESVKLFWMPEESVATEIRYRLSYSGSDGTESDPIILVNQKNYTFVDLTPETWFTFSITVVMGDAESESEAITVVTGFEKVKVPVIKRLGATKAEIGFTPALFTESNGVASHYAVIIAQDKMLDNFPNSYPTWYQVQDQAQWGPYQATKEAYNPFGRRRDQEVKFIIGDEICDETPAFCNGPLKPATTYNIKLKMCTKQEICMETEYMEFSTDENKNDNKIDINYLNSSARSSGTLVIFLISAICLVIGVVVY